MSLTEQQIGLVETTFKALGGKAQAFIDGFYQKLFAKSADIEKLFSKTDWTQQRNKVMLSLIMVVDNLHDMQHIQDMLQATVKTHASYPIQDAHYKMMVDAMIDSFNDILGDDWSSEAEIAWRIALGQIVLMLQRNPV